MTRRVYGNPEEFKGGVKVVGCYRDDETGLPMVMASVNTPDGLHFVRLDEFSWAALHAEVKKTFADGPEEDAQAA